jgi:hypothetical protein
MIRQLKRNFNPGVPVTVRTCRMKENSGDSVGVMRLGRMVGILIRVGDVKCWACRRDTLLHEWAHAMEWSAHWTDDSPKKAHGETWGVWYAKIYGFLVGECWDDMKRLGLLSREQLNADSETIPTHKRRLS